MENINDILNKQNGGDNSPRNSQVTGAGGQNPQTANAGNHSPVQPSMGYQNSVLPNTGYQNPTPQNTGYQNPVMTSTGYKNPTQPGGGYISPKPPKKDNKKLIAIIAIIAAVVIVAVIVVCVFAFGNNKKPIGGNKLTPTSETTAIEENNKTNEIRGNTLGNNSDYNCDAVMVNDCIYYIDTSDINTLGDRSRIIKVSLDYSDIQEIVDINTKKSIEAIRLNYYDGWLYIESLDCISKLNIETNEIVVIAYGNFDSINLIDGIIYTYDSINHQIVKIDNDRNKYILVDDTKIDSMIAFGGNIYYSLYDTFSLYKVDYNGQNKEQILDDDDGYRLYDLSSNNNFIYYIKDKKAFYDNVNEDGSLYRITPDGKNQEVVVDCKTYGKVLSYNFDDKYIYYSFSKDDENSEGDKKIGETWRMSFDGAIDEKISDDRLPSITIMDDIMFFYTKKDDVVFAESPVFMNTDGTNRIELK